jgi:hypothetical protein
MAPLDFSRVTLAGPLWLVDDVKPHLRIRDSDHDADITQKLEAAEEAIVAYLGAAADPTWDADTAPLAVKHAVLILTTHLYEHRGDDMAPSTSGSTPDADVWLAIGRLLAMYRDPTLA